MRGHFPAEVFLWGLDFPPVLVSSILSHFLLAPLKYVSKGFEIRLLSS